MPGPHAVVHPGAGPDAAGHPGHRHRAARPRPGVSAADVRGGAGHGVRRASRSSRCCRTGSGRSTAATVGSNAVHLQATVDRDSGRVVVVSAIDNLGKGAAGQAVQCANLMLGLPARRDRSRHDTAAALARDQAMSVTAPQGFRAAGVAAGLKPTGERDVALVVNDGPDATAAGVFTANRVKAAPVLWSQQVLRGGRGPGGGAQLRRGQRLHRAARLPGHPRHRRARWRRCWAQRPARSGAGRCRGLLDRPDRRAAADGPAARRGRRGRAPTLSRDGGPAAAEAIMTTDTRPQDRR